MQDKRLQLQTGRKWKTLFASLMQTTLSVSLDCSSVAGAIELTLTKASVCGFCARNASHVPLLRHGSPDKTTAMLMLKIQVSTSFNVLRDCMQTQQSKSDTQLLEVTLHRTF